MEITRFHSNHAVKAKEKLKRNTGKTKGGVDGQNWKILKRGNLEHGSPAFSSLYVNLCNSLALSSLFE